MGLLDILGMSGGGMPAAPDAQPLSMEDRMMSPMGQVGLQLLANHGTLQSQQGAFGGVGEALTGAVKYKKAVEKQNKTLEYLRQNHPEIAGMVDSGLDVGEAFNYALKERELKQRQTSGEAMTADMRNFGLAQSNPEFAKFIGAGQTKAPDIESYYDDEGNERKGYWDGSTGKMVPVGGAKRPSGGNGVTIGADGTIQIGGAQLPAEMGARIGLGDAFLKELPAVEQTINQGAFDSVEGRSQLAFKSGKGGEIWRTLETGKEALVRNLTGAGMSMSEAENQASRYQISPLDTKATMLDKIRGLKRDLEATRQGAIGARTGALSAQPPQGTIAPDLGTMSDEELENLANGR